MRNGLTILFIAISNGVIIGSSVLISESIAHYLDWSELSDYTNLNELSQTINKLKDLSILLGRLFVTLNRNYLFGFLE